MSQNDYTIANQGFPGFRSDLNQALQAIATNNSGATAPSTTFANMWWYETDTGIMYIRNQDNDAWIKFAELDQTNDKFILSGTLQLDDGTVSAPALGFNSDTNMGLYRGGTDILKFVTAGTDRVTINASGSVLFGQSLNDRPAEFTQPTGASIAGASGFLHGQYQSSVSGLNMLINRKGSDGPIIAFRKDGADVGSIGTQGGRLSIGSGDVNLNFNASANSMYPISNPTAGTLSDGAVDIGATLARFKDLYLSGGAFIGGTGSANKLDDYEEGVFTPTITGSTSGSGTAGAGYYTKVGRMCTISIIMSNVAFPTFAGIMNIGLPFATASQQQYNGSLIYFYPLGNWTSGDNFTGWVPNASGATMSFIRQNVNTDRQTFLLHSNTSLSGQSGNYLRMSVTYATT